PSPTARSLRGVAHLLCPACSASVEPSGRRGREWTLGWGGFHVAHTPLAGAVEDSDGSRHSDFHVLRHHRLLADQPVDGRSTDVSDLRNAVLVLSGVGAPGRANGP